MSEFDLRAWAERTLIRAGAAHRCDHHRTLFAGSDERATKRAIEVARLNRIANISPDGAELAILEIFLCLEDRCVGCED